MRGVFREDHNMFRDQARRFVDREIVPYLHEWEKNGIVPKEVWLKAGENGLLCSTVPEEYGGPGGDFGHSAVMIEELASQRHRRRFHHSLGNRHPLHRCLWQRRAEAAMAATYGQW